MAITNLRWKLAKLMNRHPRTCWAEIVGWVNHDLTLKELSEVIFYQHCKPEEGAYCGKCKDRLADERRSAT